MNGLMIPKTLRDFLEARRVVLDKYTRAVLLLNEAEKALTEVCRYGLGHRIKPELSVERATVELDRKLWREAFDKTGFMRLMDAEAVRAFNRDLDKNTPEFNEDNIRSTFLSAAQDADKMFARGLVNVFLSLRRDLHMNTDEPFKVNRKAGLGYMVQIGSVRVIGGWAPRLRVSYNERPGAILNDIDRVFKVLDGKEHAPRALEHAINAAWESADGGQVYEDDYYRIRGFKNGNMHIIFKRDDLLEKANKIIADYYHGKALAKGAA